MAALKLTLNLTSLTQMPLLMQRVLMTKHHQKWQLERAHSVLGTCCPSRAIQVK